MKKVLILSVIAMLALGVMALAGTYTAPNTPGSVSVGATCAQNSLVVTSVIGIEQGYVATATSYDASYCGATGNPLTGFYTSEGGNVLLAKLSVESNMATISVAVSYAYTGNINSSNFTTSYSNNYNDSTDILTLTGGSNGTPYTGTLYVYGPSEIQAWLLAGKYELSTTFMITPKINF